ncbi:MAG: filamentous hemagglutinin, partial [Candidatus Accumulibacter phosphatis]|nr:filamentous hemagglutinin [Candidatus Accumulibacter phosphatis]
MKRTSLNHVYRIVWSQVLDAWVAVAEITRARGKTAKTSHRRLTSVVAALLSLSASLAQGAPAGGQIASGSGSISQAGTTTTVQQGSPKLSVNWASFNVAPQEAVNFVQPSAAAIAVNRIFDTNGSQILGQLNANGQVYLINPNGIVFGHGARVNVGGLVASTLDLDDASLNGDARSFNGNGGGSVVNLGTINAASGGYVALLGNHVSNQGVISAQLGSVALGAGSAVTLTFSGNSLLRLQVDQSVLNSLAENGGLIRADGGMVLMTAGAKNALLASVVNNTGVIEARTVEDHNGTIILQGGMQAGQVKVGGTLDASAPNGGDGGFIETSAAQVHVVSDARVSTAAPLGSFGTWLIDPQDFRVAATGGDISGATLSANLASTPVSVHSSGGGSTGSGNIDIDDAVSWSADTTLTLTASKHVNVNANIAATGNAAGLAINPNTANGGEAASGDGAFNLNNGASVTLSGTNPSLAIAGTSYTVINSLGVEGDT